MVFAWMYAMNPKPNKKLKIRHRIGNQAARISAESAGRFHAFAPLLEPTHDRSARPRLSELADLSAAAIVSADVPCCNTTPGRNTATRRAPANRARTSTAAASAAFLAPRRGRRSPRRPSRRCPARPRAAVPVSGPRATHAARRFSCRAGSAPGAPSPDRRSSNPGSRRS